jgi:hypothetical protein
MTVVNMPLAIKEVEEIIEDYWEKYRATSSDDNTVSYRLTTSQSVGFNKYWADRYLQPLMFSSGFYSTFKYYKKANYIKQIVHISKMTLQQRADNGLDVVLDIDTTT